MKRSITCAGFGLAGLLTVIETPKGNYFLKLVGPAKTMDHWEQSVTDFTKSFEFR